LISRIFEADAMPLTYSHVDRLVVGGAMPVKSSLTLETSKPIGQTTFLARRELGVFNVGGAGRVICDGETIALGPHEALYVPMGTESVVFESADASAPAKFYLVSCPAHQRHALKKITLQDANTLHLGTPETANVRTLHQMIIPGRVETCQLVMGMTFLQPGSVWNTMPCHTHDRRCEAYLYFDLAADQRVFHMMGEPQETRHLVVANEQAILSPGWSIHSGVGTANYGFIWAMAGDNMDFTDMDHCAMSDLR
jgi:4-deoxy-L-threo-5-hexosulose-uronate ketol-isomerase